MKVKFLETQRYNNKSYVVGQVVKLSDETAYALGPSVEFLEKVKVVAKKEEKEIKKEVKENKIVEAPNGDNKNVKVITK